MFAPTESFATLTDPQEQAIVQLNLQACKLVRKGKIDDAVNLLRRARHACIRDKSRFKDKYKRKLAGRCLSPEKKFVRLIVGFQSANA